MQLGASFSCGMRRWVPSNTVCHVPLGWAPGGAFRILVETFSRAQKKRVYNGHLTLCNLSHVAEVDVAEQDGDEHQQRPAIRIRVWCASGVSGTARTEKGFA
jgi:hypothetical protein